VVIGRWIIDYAPEKSTGRRRGWRSGRSLFSYFPPTGIMRKMAGNNNPAGSHGEKKC
jgi:hypothetical protein